jgi:RNA polymerase sigma-70 factor (ECF subfamily)
MPFSRINKIGGGPVFLMEIITKETRTGIDSMLCEEAIKRIGLGDKAALCDLYEYTRAAVYGFALSILKNAQDAEDVLQDTYIRIYASANTYTSYGKPLAWVFTITRNLSLMKIRSDKKTVQMNDGDWDLLTSENPEISNEDKMILSSSMNILSSEECQILMLHAIGGFKHREISSLLEIPLSTGLSKYHRAIKKLRWFLSEGE